MQLKSGLLKSRDESLSVVIWASIGVYSEKNDDPDVADSTKKLVKAILGVAR